VWLADRDEDVGCADIVLERRQRLVGHRADDEIDVHPADVELAGPADVALVVAADLHVAVAADRRSSWSPPMSSTMNVSIEVFWLPPTVRVWFEPTLVARAVGDVLRLVAADLPLRVVADLSVRLFFTSMVMSFEALKNISSLPLVSSVRISFELPPPGVVAVWIELFAARLGEGVGRGIVPL
jgi:hypothetical protein